MRTQLENIERAEQYLSNEMTAPERQAFETELTTDASLRDTVAQVKALRSAVIRKELRGRIESQAGGGKGWGKGLGLGLLLLLLVGGMTWYFFSPTQTAVEVVEETPLSVSDSIEQAQWAEGKFELGGHKLWAKPDIQRFGFASSEGATIEGKDGILVIVPSNAFVDSSGKVVSGKVEFKLLEALGIEQMVLYRLKTMSNGSMLESGGMFYIEAQVDGTPVQINPARPLYIEIPTPEKKPGMMAFTGKVDADGNLNWENPRPLKKYLVKLPLGDLDFLPPGFANEVEGNMPFLSYKKATEMVTDSLYYSLEYSFVADVESEASIQCGIDPVSVETIKKPTYANTFIATKEFEQRIQALHRANKGEELLQLYVHNLGKDLSISDSLVARAVQADLKAQFEAFAKENLTNIKDADIYQKRLSDFYQSKRKELKHHHQAMADKFAAMNATELRKMQTELNNVRMPKSYGGPVPAVSPMLTSMVAAMPSPSAATSLVYASPWYDLGWANIDAYFKLLDQGSIEVSIAIANKPDNTNVTQWLGDINTYTDLRNQDGKYVAFFPAKTSSTNAQTHTFAIAQTGQDYSWSMTRFNPRTQKGVEMAMATASIIDIQADLKGVDMDFGKLRQRMFWKEEQARKAVAYQIQAIKNQEEWLKKQAEMKAKYEADIRNKKEKYDAVVRKQQEIQNMIGALRAIAFPCEKSVVTDDVAIEDEQVSVAEAIDFFPNEQVVEPDFFTIVEDMPQFPGGDAALMKFITNNTRYPQTAMDNNISGVVYVSYIVGADGRIGNVRVVRGVNAELNAEAVRVVKLLPRCTPGRQRGQAVAVQYTIPVQFRLD
jgi:TonB family protein